MLIPPFPLPIIGVTDGTGALALTLPMLDAARSLAGLAGLVCGARYLTKNAYRLVGVDTCGPGAAPLQAGIGR